MESRSVCPQFVRGPHNIRVTPVQRHNGDTLSGPSTGTTLNLVRRPRPVGLGSLRRTAVTINQSFPAPVLQISPNNSHLESTHMSSSPNNGDTPNGPSTGTTLNLVRRPRPVGLGSLRRTAVTINQSFPAPVLQISPNNSDLESTYMSSSLNNNAEDANVENDKFENSSGVDHSFMNQCIENELQCNICQEILFKPTVLNCTHTFCYVCIESWTSIKNQCPLCRVPVTNTTYCRSLDTFLDKITPLLSKDIQSKRQTRIEEYN